MNRYLLIDHTLPKVHIPNMLGRVVVEKTDPLRNFVPDPDGQEGAFHPKDIVPDISDDPVQYDDLSRIIETAQNDQAKVRLTELLRGYAHQQTKRDVKIKAAVVMRYDMNGIGRKLIRLMADGRYKSQVVELLQNTHGKVNESLPLVTGMLTCRDLEVEFDEQKDGGAEIQGRAPVGKATGTTDAVDPEVEYVHSKSKENNVQAKIKDEVVFALAYDEAKLQRWFTKKKKCLFRKAEEGEPKVVLGNKILGDGINLYFGPPDYPVDDGDIGISDNEEAALAEKGAPPGTLPFTLYHESTKSLPVF